MPTAPEPPRNHGNPGEIDNTENLDDEDECESHEVNDENKKLVGAKNFKGAAGQKFDVHALHENMTDAMREATEELVPKAPHRVQRGRKASARTEGLREQRTKLMSAKKNGNHPGVVAIDDDINESRRQDCRDWVDGVAAEMQTASDKNDSKTVYQLAGLLGQKRTATVSQQTPDRRRVWQRHRQGRQRGAVLAEVRARQVQGRGP